MSGLVGGERALLLEVTGLAKVLGPNPVLRDVSLRVAPASIHAPRRERRGQEAIRN